MIEAGVNALRSIQTAILAKDVTYRHGSESRVVKAVPGRTVFRSENDYGRWVRTETRDFIIPAGQLASFPERGDVIEFDGGEFEVLAPNDEPVWRWSDPFRTAVRVHAKHTGGDE